MKYLIAFILFLLPSEIAFILVNTIKRNKLIFRGGGKVGFSIIIADEIEFAPSAKIGHFNLIMVKSLKMDEHSQVKYFNLIKGRFNLILNKKAIINQFNKITSRLTNERESTLNIGFNSIVGVKHVIDLTHNVTIKRNSIMAGVRSQIWTHGFYHPSDIIDHWRIDGEVVVGENVYLGSASIICAGVEISDNITVGAGCVVSKSLNKKGLYVNQELRFIEFDSTESIKKYHKIAPNIFEKNAKTD